MLQPIEQQASPDKVEELRQRLIEVMDSLGVKLRRRPKR